MKVLPIHTPTTTPAMGHNPGIVPPWLQTPGNPGIVPPWLLPKVGERPGIPIIGHGNIAVPTVFDPAGEPIDPDMPHIM